MNTTLLVVSGITSAATTVIAALTLWQVKLLRDQFRTRFEDSLTAQYRRIMESIPLEIWLGSELTKLTEENRSCCSDAIYRYVDLCQDQAFLHLSGRIADDTWREWSDGIVSNMELPAFKEVWAQVSQRHPKGFAEFRGLLREAEKDHL